MHLEQVYIAVMYHKLQGIKFHSPNQQFTLFIEANYKNYIT